MKKVIFSLMLVFSSACYADNTCADNISIDAYTKEHKEEIVTIMNTLTKQLEEGSIQREDVIALMKDDAELGFVALATTLIVGALIVGGGYIVYDALVW